ncbi:hypothetical protein DIPPA_12219 [Diplonema papillatum]|nr:hypothetical protein DIPPA_12219 [Diplonema papillatum]
MSAKRTLSEMRRMGGSDSSFSLRDGRKGSDSKMSEARRAEMRRNESRRMSMDRGGASWNIRVSAFLPSETSDVYYNGTEVVYTHDDGTESTYSSVKLFTVEDHKGFCGQHVEQLTKQAQKGYNCLLLTYGNHARSRVSTLIDQYGIVYRTARHFMRIARCVKVSILSVGTNSIIDEFGNPNKSLHYLRDDVKNYVLDARVRRQLENEEQLMDTLGTLEETLQMRQHMKQKMLWPAVVVILEGVVQVTNTDAGTIVTTQLMDLPSPSTCQVSESFTKYIAAYRKEGIETTTSTPITQLIRQFFTLGGNTVFLAAHLSNHRRDRASNKATLDFCQQLDGISLPRARKPYRSESALKDRLVDIEYYESHHNPTRFSELNKTRINDDLQWIRQQVGTKEKDAIQHAVYKRISDLEESHYSEPYLRVISPEARAGLALVFSNKYTVFGRDPWRKKHVSVAFLKGIGLAADHASIMWDSTKSRLVLCSMFGDSHLNNRLMGKAQKKILFNNDTVTFGTNTKYKVVFPNHHHEDEEDDDVDSAYLSDDEEFAAFTTRIVTTRVENQFGTCTTTVGWDPEKSVAEDAEETEDTGNWGPDEDMERQMNEFLASVISNDPMKANPEINSFVDQILGEDAKGNKVQSETDKLLDDILNGRMLEEAAGVGDSSPTAKQKGKRNRRDRGEKDTNLFDNEPSEADSSCLPKVRVFISMYGDNFLKFFMCPPDLEYDEFMERIEVKFGQAGLSVFYEDPQNDFERVEIMDDYAVSAFFRRHEDENLRLYAFPAELSGTRLATLPSARGSVADSEAGMFDYAPPSLPPTSPLKAR